MFAVVAVYNDREVLQHYLVESLTRQTVPYEFIPVDNPEGDYSSCARALNEGAARIESDSRYVLFIHQDIRLQGDDWLETTEKMLDTLPDLGVAGVAGAVKSSWWSRQVISNVFHGHPPEQAGNRRCETPVPVETVDACSFIIPRQVIARFSFDEAVCDGFHLHDVDYCLTVRQAGLNVYCIPSSVYHFSKGMAHTSPWGILRHLGEFPGDYYRSLKKVLKKHRARHSTIFTPCGTWSTRYPLAVQRILHSVIMSLIIVRKTGFRSQRHHDTKTGFK